MSSFIYIWFDRTPPEVEIYAPSYTTRELLNEITIEANENIADDHHEIYAIDSNGDRHDYTFEKELDNRFVGFIKFSDLPIGIVTIYARMKDDVDNFSNLIGKSIEIKENLTLLQLSIGDKQRNIFINDSNRNIEINDKSRSINIDIKNKEVFID